MNNEKKYHIFQMKLGVLNIFSVILLLLMITLTILIYDLFNIEFKFELTNKNLGLIFILYLIYIIIHELFHAISYRIYGASQNITFGAYIEKGIICCLCKENISRKNILNSLMFPLFYLGIITYFIGIIFSLPILVILSILNISGCAGDILMFIFIIKLKDIEYTEFDDPISFALFTSEDLSNKKPFGIKYITETTQVKRTNQKKLEISKTSYIFFIALIALTILLIY